MCNIKSCGKNTLGDIFSVFLDCYMKCEKYLYNICISLCVFQRKFMAKNTTTTKTKKEIRIKIYKKSMVVVGVDCWCLPLFALMLLVIKHI